MPVTRPSLYEALVGVYAGAGISTYLLRNLLPQPQLIESARGISAADFQ